MILISIMMGTVLKQMYNSCAEGTYYDNIPFYWALNSYNDSSKLAFETNKAVRIMKTTIKMTGSGNRLYIINNEW